MPNYVITESVGNRVERVNSYRDLEKHHPSSGREAGREYRTIDGELEEVRTRNRTEPHVKKDFIIDPPTIPAPASGTIRVLNDDWNTVQIVDDNGRVLAQSLHMARGSQPANGSRIEYGQPMGRMGDVGSPGSVHAHVEAPAAVFERYINDITSGRIQSNGAVRPGAGAVNADPMADGVLKHGERGDAVTRLQTALNNAGIRDESGQPLPTTGYYGDRTEAAVRKYQEQKGLEVDGKAGNDTLTALGLKQGVQAPRPQTPDPQQPQQPQTPQAQTPQPQTPQPQAQTPANPDAKANFAASGFLKSQSPEVRAYLDLVAWKEVHQSLNADGSPAGYRERNGVAGSRGLMPESAIADNGTLPRDELRYNVGRYQMKQVDVDDMRKRYDAKIDDFSPESQDRIAVAKMKYRGVMEPLQNGDIRTAIERGGKEWASLPGSPYGQVQAGYTVDKAVDYYNERLAFHRAIDKGQTPPARTESGATQAQSGGVGDTLLLKEERGEGVRRLQDALNKAGIRDEQGQPLPTTGYFGDKTEAAVRRYQEQKGLEVDGKAGENTLKALGIFPGQPQTPTQPKADTPTPVQPEQATPPPTQPRADTPTQPQPTQPQPNTPQQPNATIPANLAASEGILQQGSTGPEVAKLQTMLNNQGFRGPDGQPIPTNGTFDAATTHALKAFEKENGMDPNGIAGPKTLEALSKAEQSPKLSNPNHPDNALYQQAMKGLEQMPAGTFKNAQERENAAATIAFEAKVSGLSQIDHVKAGGNNAGFFAVQGGLEDPTNKRVYVDREQAVQQTVQQSTQLMQQNTQNQPQAPAQDTTQQPRENTQRGALLA